MATANDVERARREGMLFGVPFGDLGWFASLLMGLTTGMIAFFLATFFAIVGFAIYGGATHHMPDFAMTYKRVGFPVGVVVGGAALSYLAVQWVRRMRRKFGRA